MKKLIAVVLTVVMMLAMGLGAAAPAVFAQVDEEWPLVVEKTLLDAADDSIVQVDEPPYTGDGDSLIEVGEKWYFLIEIAVTNDGESTVEDIVVKDHLGADLEVYDYDAGTGTVTVVGHGGKGDQPRITWDLGDLDDGETASLWIIAYTDVNPGGNQRYTSTCTHYLNSGATAKGTYEGHKTSASSDQLSVEVFWDLEGDWDGQSRVLSPVVGDWVSFNMSITSQIQTDGSCTLGGTVSAGGDTYTLTGTTSCDDVDITLTLDGDGHEITVDGTVTEDGQMSGTWTDNAGNSGEFTATKT